MMQTTFAIIKPDAVKAKFSGKIVNRIEQEGFEIVGMRKMVISRELAEKFYAVHKERPFFGELVSFMTSGPVIVMALRKENAILAWRELMEQPIHSKQLLVHYAVCLVQMSEKMRHTDLTRLKQQLRSWHFSFQILHKFIALCYDEIIGSLQKLPIFMLEKCHESFDCFNYFHVLRCTQLLCSSSTRTFVFSI